jgi:hypothetical protein
MVWAGQRGAIPAGSQTLLFRSELKELKELKEMLLSRHSVYFLT